MTWNWDTYEIDTDPDQVDEPYDDSAFATWHGQNTLSLRGSGTVRLTSADGGQRSLHVEADGVKVVIEIGLVDEHGRPVTRVDTLVDDESRGGDLNGYVWRQDGPRIIRTQAGQPDAEAAYHWWVALIEDSDRHQRDMAWLTLSQYEPLVLSHYALVELAVLVWQHPPDLLGPVDAAQALAVTAAVVDTERVPRSSTMPEDAHGLWRDVHRCLAGVVRHDEVTSLAEETQRAALMAVQQLGGAARVAIPLWLEDALADDDHSATVAEHLLDEVQLAVANTAPGREWRRVAGLGTVVLGEGAERVTDRRRTHG